MIRKLIPPFGLAGVLWLTTWWLTLVEKGNPGLSVEKMVAVFPVAFISIGLLRVWISILPAGTIVTVLSVSFTVYSAILLGLGESNQWQMSVMTAAAFLAAIGAGIGVEKILGVGWQYTVQQMRGLLVGSLLLVTAASLYPLLHAVVTAQVPELAWLSKAGAWLASFRFR